MDTLKIRSILQGQLAASYREMLDKIENTSTLAFVLRRQAFEIVTMPRTPKEFLSEVLRAWLIRSIATRLGNTMEAVALQVIRDSYPKEKVCLPQNGKTIMVEISQDNHYDFVAITTKKNTLNKAGRQAILNLVKKRVKGLTPNPSQKFRTVVLLLGEIGAHNLTEFDLVLGGPEAWGYLANDPHGRDMWKAVLSEASGSKLNTGCSLEYLQQNTIPIRCEKLPPVWFAEDGMLDHVAIVDSLEESQRCLKRELQVKAQNDKEMAATDVRIFLGVDVDRLNEELEDEEGKEGDGAEGDGTEEDEEGTAFAGDILDLLEETTAGSPTEHGKDYPEEDLDPFGLGDL